MIIGNIDFNNIDTTSKCYTIPNYNYWLSSTLINGANNTRYTLNTSRLKKIIEGNNVEWLNKLGLHGLTINWGGAQITINGETKTINTTPDLLKAIQDASIIDSSISNSNNAIKASVVKSKFDDLESRIDELKYNGHEYIEIGGLKWATMNVGATSETDYGLYFQWGDTTGYTANQVGNGGIKKYFDLDDYKYSSSEANMTKYNYVDGKTTLDLADDAARANWGGGWRMPTYEEIQSLINAVNVEWTTNYNGSGVNGLLCTDKTDSSKKLFFPAASYVNEGSIQNLGITGNIWSSSRNGDDNSDYAPRYLFFNSNSSMFSEFVDTRGTGCSVRGVID